MLPAPGWTYIDMRIVIHGMFYERAVEIVEQLKTDKSYALAHPRTASKAIRMVGAVWADPDRLEELQEDANGDDDNDD